MDSGDNGAPVVTANGDLIGIQLTSNVVTPIDIDKVLALTKDEDLILDIGCGDNKVTGAIGLDNLQCKWAYQYEDVDIIADGGWLPFQSDLFRNVCMIRFLEHCASPLLALEEAYRVLKYYGRLAIVVPNTTYMHRLKWNLLGKPIMQTKGHFQSFDMSEITNMLKRTDFRYAKFSYDTIYKKTLYKGYPKHLSCKHLVVEVWK